MSTGKGKKRLRNQPALYSEIKEHHKIYLTPTSWNKIKELSKERGLSVSEYIEQWIRDTAG
ncbi:hypothetical protein G7B40_003535 [Aetokthonos hydrillicola Thurmond2011]|jgi:aspartate/tyrosine/aromatic aminotransferase|uniref:Ribbon-helix-helix protein CopG domain-containing protein n=1 Tax=Aetokthonos hydrillicola Thurmond2011 TaxID=2712845 RepID=A0AAP5I2L9_9CYAN|nr:hypothetical protein [Aetokthonos hydrillicola]MBO3462290.1 hypothetical protein [Aetokthonos hydrillicola CCALA 1050]MBW4590802.1 hypothetical protein [Aetokthonos hydrillicola CCALA 1050]MDR9893654.1 hypothetical protein [Aetokthonos hydrillicola Thurmond2011]